MYFKSCNYFCRFVEINGLWNKIPGLYVSQKTENTFCRAVCSSQVRWLRSRRTMTEIADNHSSRSRDELTNTSTPLQIQNSEIVKSAEVITPRLSTKNMNHIQEGIPVGDQLFKKIVSSQKNKKQRIKENVILLEGSHLIETAVSSGLQMKYLFYSKEQSLSDLVMTNIGSDKVLKVREKTLRMLGSKTLSDVIGICAKPAITEMMSTLPVTILCSNVRDTSNLACILNVAVATGCKSVLLTKGCVDPWERKVLNSANGAHFHIPIHSNISLSEVKNFVPNNAAFFIADSSTDVDIDDSQIYSDVNYGEDMLNDMETSQINLLKSSDVEAICSYSNDEKFQKSMSYEMPCHLYCAAFPNRDIVLCVGGETEGIDARLEELGHEFHGQKLKIPLENEVESLNVSSALSIILFEIKRQFTKENYVKQK